DRIVLLREGRIVADGATTEVRALAGGRTLRCTLPLAGLNDLGSLLGVASVSVHGNGVSMTCTDSDAMSSSIAKTGSRNRVEALRIAEQSGWL
ncbi:MAG TPA: hypothetical protein VGI44_08345, partial [Acidimicrobiales bacterium]